MKKFHCISVVTFISSGGSRGGSMGSMEPLFWRDAFENTVHKCTTYTTSHWSYTHFSFTVAITHACMSSHSCIKNSTRAWPTSTYNIQWAKRASELKQRFYSCIASSAARDGDMLSIKEHYFPLLTRITSKMESHLILQTSNTETRFSRSSNFTPRIHQKRSQKVRNPKFSWGGMPPDPPRRRAMRFNPILEPPFSKF